MLVAGFLLILFENHAHAQSPALPPGFEIKAQVQPPKAAIGDPIQIDFEIALPAGFQIQFPNPGDSVAYFAVLEFLPGPTLAAPTASSGKGAPAKMPDGRSIHRARIIVAMYRVGDFEFPGLKLSLKSTSGLDLPVKTPPIKVEIQSIVDPKDQELRDLKKQSEISEPLRWIFWIAVALALLLVSILGWWYWKRRKRPPLPMPAFNLLDPFDAAEAELRDLLGRGLLERGAVKQFYISLADILKKVLEAGHDIQTVEKTTVEILENLRVIDRPPTGVEQDRIELFLSASDLVKFAKHLPTKAENDTIVREAQRILEACRNLRTVAPVPRTEPVERTA